MKKITKIILAAGLVGLIFLVGFFWVGQKKSPTPPTVAPIATPTPTPQPQATWQLTPTVQNIQVGESAIFELTLVPFQNQVIDGFDLIFDQTVQIKEPTNKLDFLRRLEENGRTIISFAAKSQDTQGFALQTSLLIGKITFTPNQIGQYKLHLLPESGLVSALNSQKIPVTLTNSVQINVN